MKKSKNLLTSKGIYIMALMAITLTAFILAGDEQQLVAKRAAIQKVQEAPVEQPAKQNSEILNQVSQAQLDQSHLEHYKKSLESFCHLHTGECSEFVSENLANIFSWDLQKILFLLEVVIMGNDSDYGLVGQILDYQVPAEVLNADNHEDNRLQTITITKTVALKVFNQKLGQGATSETDNEQFKQDLIKLAHDENDLMLVRNALVILKQSFSFEKNDILELVGHRSPQDNVAYQDLL